MSRKERRVLSFDEATAVREMFQQGFPRHIIIERLDGSLNYETIKRCVTGSTFSKVGGPVVLPSMYLIRHSENVRAYSAAMDGGVTNSPDAEAVEAALAEIRGETTPGTSVMCQSCGMHRSVVTVALTASSVIPGATEQTVIERLYCLACYAHTTSAVSRLMK